ncbi:MAG: hypothetical protein KatS3mg021_1891 [Fimbriimonadales bacterium]|nr:MAG: hypothetical protein KatS3mg021_1891 [Fimbriimonadales bacterium]
MVSMRFRVCSGKFKHSSRKSTRQWGREWYLVDAQQRLTTQTPAYLLHVEGECLDFGTPEEYRHAFCVLAERGGKRNA